jgi:hypothetical protein
MDKNDMSKDEETNKNNVINNEKIKKHKPEKETQNKQIKKNFSIRKK